MILDEKQFNEIKTGIAGMEAGVKSVSDANKDVIKRLAELEVEVKRPRMDQSAAVKVDEKATAYFNFMRKGEKLVTADELKLLTVTDDTTGGYLAPKEFSNEIIRLLEEFSPMRGMCRVRTTSRKALQIPKRTGHIRAFWVTDSKDVISGEYNQQFGMEEVPVHEMGAMVDIAQSNLDDTEYNLEQELMGEFAEQFGVAECVAFLNGNKVGKPEGMLVNSELAKLDASTAHKITVDEILDMFYGIKSGYSRNAVWMMNRDTVKEIKKLKDLNGQFMWAPGINAAPDTLMGRPIFENPDMALLSVDDSYPILFGDFKKAYTILDRKAVTVMRDPYTQATKSVVRYIARKRVGGQMILPEAILAFKTKNS